MKKVLTSVLVMLFTFFTVFSQMPAQAARKPTVVPKVQFASAPVTEYKVGDRVGFNIYSPNYGGRVEYRVVLWNDSQKTYYDLWNSGNGYPTRYYTKWQPYGNNIFTLGWIINEPGSYRITVYAKRVGVPNNKTALKGMNCDSYMESVAFRVKPRTVTVQSIMPVADVTVNQYSIPALPSTVRGLMSDGTEKALKVTWGLVDTTKPGTYIIQGTVEGTTLKASLRLIVNPLQTTLNVYSVEAGSLTTVNVNLREPISYTPELLRFSLSGYGVPYVRLYSVYMSTDRKIVQLSTDTLALGSWYTLKVDGKEYSFQVPYNMGNNGYRVTLTARDMTLSVGGSTYPDISVYPTDAALSFTSYNSSIARYNYSTGKIEGINPGTTTFSVTASKTGYASATDTFTVTVTGYSASLTASPNVLNEASINDGSLVSGELTVTSPYEYFRQDVNTNNVLLNNLPHGFTYSVNRSTTNNRVLYIHITGQADNHSNLNDTYFHVTVLNGLYGGSEYLISNDILINFIDAPQPAAPTISISPTTVTNGDVTVTVEYPAGAQNKEYKIGSGNYQDYTGPFTVSQNTTVYARYKNSAGVPSAVGSREITNIDRTIPQDPIITINPTTPTNTGVAVTITYPSDAVVKQYKIGNGEYQNYSTAFAVTSNITIYARCQNQAGNWSGITEREITNIDTDKPVKPTLTADPTTATNQNVKVTISYSADTVVKKYRVDGGEWKDYSEPVVMTANGTVEAQGIDAAGNASLIESLEVTNIDKVKPPTPHLSANPTTPVQGNVMVTIDNWGDAVSKKYRVNNGQWKNYVSPIKMSANGRVEAQGEDAVGNKSEIGSIEVNNIDNKKPTILSARFTSATTVEIKFSESVDVDLSCFINGKFKYMRTIYGDFTVTSIAGDGSDTIILQITENVELGDINGSTTGKITVTSGVKDLAGNALSERTINIDKGNF